MEASAFKTPATATAISTATAKPQPHSHSPTFLLPNGFVPAEAEISDIEMMTFQSVAYTSLRDLLPASPPSAMSPTQNSSWYEVPIRNPLVKHAALAYLQPMSSPPEVGDKGLMRIIREKCGCAAAADGLGCFAWVGDAVSRAVRGVFGGVCRSGFDEIEDEDEDDDDDDDYECVKVD